MRRGSRRDDTLSGRCPGLFPVGRRQPRIRLQRVLDGRPVVLRQWQGAVGGEVSHIGRGRAAPGDDDPFACPGQGERIGQAGPGPEDPGGVHFTGMRLTGWRPA